MNVWHDIDDKRINPESFLAIVEISKGEKTKYELDKESGLLILDRVLYTSTHYPASYGFIPRTLADDGDPLDVLILCNVPIQPMVLVHCYPIGVINMNDNNSRDEKIIAIPFNDPTYNSYTDITDLPAHIFEEMRHFFSVYKELEGKTTAVDEVMHAEKAREIIKQSIENYKREFNVKC
jgi:inorganic pyrophosphatase